MTGMRARRWICALIWTVCTSHGWPLVATASSIRISEVVADNGNGIRGPNGSREDWIELENTGDGVVNLSEYGLNDDPSPEAAWRLPELEIGPGERAVFFAAGKAAVEGGDDGTGFHLPFKVDSSGETLRLFRLDGGGGWTLAQELPVPELDEDQSYGVTADQRWGFLQNPTPGLANGELSREWYDRSCIRIEPASGIKSAPLTCVLETSGIMEGIEIFMTVDGRQPSPENGTRYHPGTPLPVDETSVLRFAFFRDGIEVTPQRASTYLFHGQLFAESGGGFAPPGWPPDWGRNAVYYGPSREKISEWQWDQQLEEAFESIPVFSLIMDLEDLFSIENGIYANSPMKGREWERRCLLEFIPGDGRPNFDVNAGIRIRGGFSRNSGNPKHSLRFLFRGEYGDRKLEYPVFGESAAGEFDHLDLRCSQNYSWSFGMDSNANFIRDQFNRDVQIAMGQPGVRGDFCHLFINGLYWGLYNFTERPEASYGESYFGGKKKHYDVIKSAGFNWGGRYGRQEDDREIGPTGTRMRIEATDGTLDAWKDLWDLTQRQGGFRSMANYNTALGRDRDGRRDKSFPVLLDAANLADYMLTVLSMGNRDAPLTSGGDRPNNWYAVRNSKGEDGFRFFIWDAEHTLLSPFEDRTGPWGTGDLFEYSNPQYFWEQCLLNEEFRFLVRDRMHRHYSTGGALTESVLRGMLLDLALRIEDAVVAESARWGSRVADDPMPYNILNREEHWRPAVERIYLNYLPVRPAVFYTQMEAWGLTHRLPEPELARSETAGQPAIIRIPDELTGEAVLVWVEETAKAGGSSDPREYGGSVAEKAQTTTDPISVAPGMTVTARLKAGNQWGPMLRAAAPTAEN